MLREFTCIMCPRGCEITAELQGETIGAIEGNACPKGREYVMQELISPMRNIASSIRVTGGETPLASVRLTGPIPRDRIFDVMKEIRKIELPAPVQMGQVAIADVLGLGQDVIITRNIASIANQR